MMEISTRDIDSNREYVGKINRKQELVDESANEVAVFWTPMSGAAEGCIESHNAFLYSTYIQYICTNIAA